MATRLFVPASADAEATVEARTQALGHALLAHARAYSPPPMERLQDAMMTLLADPVLRSRFLRLVDVLAAPGLLEDSRTVKQLAREYLDRPLPGLPAPLAWLLRLGLSGVVPPPVVAFFVRRLIFLVADRFITHGGARGLVRTLTYLAEHGRYPSFDLLGEAVLSHTEAAQYKAGYLALIERLGGLPEAAGRTRGGIRRLQCSIKLSSLVADFNPADPAATLARVRGPFEEVLEAARARGVAITIDMEQYAFRDLTWYLFTRLFARGERFGDWPDIGIVLQAYLKDSAEQARAIVRFARERGTPFQVRLVKGAYWDYETIIAAQHGWPVPVFQQKPATDVSFESLARPLLEAYPHLRLAVGSHNLRSHAYVEALRERLGLPDHAVEHQTLFRTAESVSRALTAMGWEARDYVPVGDLLPGMAYLVRRILENSSQAGFLMRNRLGEDPKVLLRDPRAELAAGAAPGPAPAGAEAGVTPPDRFLNHPPARLFKREERLAFARALKRTRAQWGAEYPLRLGDEEVRTADRRASYSPSHPRSEPVGYVYFAGPAEVDRAIALAQEGFREWSARPLAARAAVLQRAATLLAAARDEVAAWVVHEAGKNWPGALADVDEAIDYLRFYPYDALRRAGALEREYAPRGVVAVIPPWNFPIAIPCGMTAAALIAGNAVILKPAEQTPLITAKLVEVLHRAGVPRTALIHLPGAGEVAGQRLVESADIDMVAFTGSRAVGTAIYRAASRVAPTRGGIKRVVAEMGGKNPILVFADADLDEAVAGILQSAFGHANQKCSAAARVFVERAIYDRLKARLVDAAASLTLGPADDADTFINPLIDHEARERVLRYAAIARREGRVLLDAAHPAPDSLLVGPLLVELPLARAGTAITAQEEIFGPVLALIPFEDPDAAIRAANSTPYALTAGVFSRRPSTIARVLREVRAGNIYVNREITGARVGIEPFGGFQMSGTGPKAGGEEYLLAFLRRRAGWRDLPPWPSSPDFVGTGLKGGGSPGQARSSDPGSPLPFGDGTGARAAGVGGWGPGPSLAAAWDAPLDHRLRVLQAALPEAKPVLARAEELRPSRPTRTIPGQRTELRWDRPRGQGIVAVDAGAAPDSLATLTAAALLAGNVVRLVVPAARRGDAAALVERLHRAGVPRTALALAPPEVDPCALARGDITFAATDLDLPTTRALYAALGDTPEAAHHLKALLPLQEGPRPGGEGFLRQFTLPTTVAIRTLRNGADLDFT